jgi:hypothetical protein
MYFGGNRCICSTECGEADPIVPIADHHTDILSINAAALGARPIPPAVELPEDVARLSSWLLAPIPSARGQDDTENLRFESAKRSSSVETDRQHSILVRRLGPTKTSFNSGGAPRYEMGSDYAFFNWELSPLIYVLES